MLANGQSRHLHGQEEAKTVSGSSNAKIKGAETSPVVALLPSKAGAIYSEGEKVSFTVCRNFDLIRSSF